jgi:hypothetical protein
MLMRLVQATASNAILSTLALLLAFAATTFADDGKETHVSHTISLWGGDVVGARYQLHVPLGQGHHWTVSPGVGYGYDTWKQEIIEQGLPISPTTLQGTNSYWDTMLDLLYFHGSVGGEDLCGGPGLFYSSSTRTDKQTGMPDVTYGSDQTFGAQLTLGGGIPFGSKLKLTGSITERAGFFWYDHHYTSPTSEVKYSAISNTTQFGVGLRFHL